MSDGYFQNGEWVSPEPPMDLDNMFNAEAYLEEWINSTADIQTQKKIAEFAYEHLRIKLVIQDEQDEQNKAA